MESSKPGVDLSSIPREWLGHIELDVGCHRGTFLIASALRFPERFFLGIERQAERVRKTSGKIQRSGLSNALVLHADGWDVVRALPDAGVAAVHVLFSDPWPKRRHASRRLISPAFLSECERTLRPGGLLRILTDSLPYSEEIAGHLESMPGLAPTHEPDDYPSTRFQTNFEGQPVHRVIRRKALTPHISS